MEGVRTSLAPGYRRLFFRPLHHSLRRWSCLVIHGGGRVERLTVEGRLHAGFLRCFLLLRRRHAQLLQVEQVRLGGMFGSRIENGGVDHRDGLLPRDFASTEEICIDHVKDEVLLSFQVNVDFVGVKWLLRRVEVL